MGSDDFGNKYYCNKNKRWVVFHGMKETSKIPPEWHLWMHYAIDNIPKKIKLYEWQKSYEPNLTGTQFAYCPEMEKEEVF